MSSILYISSIIKTLLRNKIIKQYNYKSRNLFKWLYYNFLFSFIMKTENIRFEKDLIDDLTQFLLWT